METCIIKDALDGGCGEEANTTGCEPVIRGFDPHHPPHKKNKVLNLGLF